MTLATMKTQIAERVDRDELVDLASELAKMPTFAGDETPAAEYLHRLFQAEGLESEMQEVDPGRLQTIARWPGSGGGRTLMLNGHLDIDPLPADTFGRDLWTPTVEDDRLYGAGIFNMKGGVATMINATLAAKRAGFQPRGDVVLACVVGELHGGVGTSHLLRTGMEADMAICLEPLSSHFIQSKQAGVLQFAVHLEGVLVHSMVGAERGVNAVSKMAKAIQALEDVRLACEPDPDFPALPTHTVGSAIGGHGSDFDLRGAYMIPDRAMIYVDARFPQGLGPDDVIAQFDGVLAGLAADDPEFRYEIEFPIVGREALRQPVPPVHIPDESELIVLLKRNVEEVAGYEPFSGATIPAAYTATDIAHLYTDGGIPAVSWGPGWQQPEGEAPWIPEDGWLWISVSELETCARVLGGMVVDVCG